MRANRTHDAGSLKSSAVHGPYKSTDAKPNRVPLFTSSRMSGRKLPIPSFRPCGVSDDRCVFASTCATSKGLVRNPLCSFSPQEPAQNKSGCCEALSTATGSIDGIRCAPAGHICAGDPSLFILPKTKTSMSVKWLCGLSESKCLQALL